MRWLVCSRSPVITVADQVATTQRLLRTAITALNEYAEHRVLLQKIERLGVDAPSTVRYIDEYRRRHEAV